MIPAKGQTAFLVFARVIERIVMLNLQSRLILKLSAYTCGLIALPMFCAGSLSAAEIEIAFWNVENLFDAVDDPTVDGDEEFTPNGPKKWTENRIQIKVANLVRVIGDMNYGRGPEILGLCEVENRAILDRLASELKKKTKRDYQVVHAESQSFRGIDCALLFDPAIATLKSKQFHQIANEATRDIVEAELEIANQSLFVFVNHWPSRRSPDEARVKVAGVLRKRVDRLLANNPGTDFVIVGDLNDTPTNLSVSKTLRTWSDPDDLRPGVLLNTMWQIHQDSDRGTYVFQNRWQVLDHVIYSPGMLDRRGFHWVRGSTREMKAEYQMFVIKRDGRIPVPSRSYSGPTFHSNGYSDHLPVSSRIAY